MVADIVHVIGGHLLLKSSLVIGYFGFAVGGMVWEVQLVGGTDTEATSKPPKMSLHY